MSEFYLAADIGGTKTALALFSKKTGPFNPITKESYPSQDFASLHEIVEKFLAKNKVSVSGASFGVAGPVKGDRAEVTNLPWTIDAGILSELIDGMPVKLLNDLLATAHAVPNLTPADLHPLIPGESKPRGAVGVIAPGTGLGEAFLTWDGTNYRAHPSEGGHANFGPATQTEMKLLEYLQAKLEHVSYERACSGRAIPDLYAFIHEVQKIEEPEWLRASLASATDATRVILQSAVEETAEISVQTLHLFLDILASEAGNLALKVMATGGIYIGGGIPPRILSRIDKVRFREAFIRKGRFTELLSHIPVHVILKPDIALFGAACHGFEQIKSASRDENDNVS
ncbi:MAG: glucokinase [Anaerolineales bacterium]|nr:glucokinase [Anaerolineales bacterium]